MGFIIYRKIIKFKLFDISKIKLVRNNVNLDVEK